MSHKDLGTNQPFVGFSRFEWLVYLGVAASIILTWVKFFNSYN